MSNRILRPFYLATTFLITLSLISCISNNGSGSPQQDFELETFVFDDIPSDIRSQIEGAGCVYTTKGSSDRYLMISGLVKINGVYEKLDALGGTDYSKEKYENERWVIFIDVISNDSFSNEPGTIKLRSKKADGQFTAEILRSCGT